MGGALAFPAAVLALPAARALDVLAYATPVAATSHQLAVRRAAEALARGGHRVTLLEPAAAKTRVRFMDGGDSLSNLTVEYRSHGRRDLFQAFPGGRELPEPFARGERAARAPGDAAASRQALRPRGGGRALPAPGEGARAALGAPPVRQCDPDAIPGAWFHYGLAVGRGWQDVGANVRFVGLWLLSWLFAGHHQAGVPSGSGPLTWAEYYGRHVPLLLLQGTRELSFPLRAAELAALHPARVHFVGSLTARPWAQAPAELGLWLAATGRDPDSTQLALVAFGTKALQCPTEMLRALADEGLTAVVLVEACRHELEPTQQHLAPASRDQAAWLRAPGLRLAVVHGGIHSLLEAVGAGVPVACVPHEGDQWRNCRDLQRRGLGWAVRPKAEAAEAQAAFRMLLQGGFTSPEATRALEEAGGPAAVVEAVESLALPSGSRGPARAAASSMPFFAAPLSWQEAWVLLAMLLV
ncbi:unnamed protein product, partial [Prorocentrum cordatum]